MDWRSWGKYAKVLSDAPISQVHNFKGYSISKVLVGEKWIYELWKLPKQEKLGTFENADSAKLYLASKQDEFALLDGKTKQDRR